MSKITEELKAYKDELKENENQIKLLIKSNKHIKEHIKYLEQQIHAVDGHEVMPQETPPPAMTEVKEEL